jgi:tetratricopeptide (TPR) repeat protein
LDVIRFSVDGARQESYGKYRINGKLDLILTFIEKLQADKAGGSRLYIEWKYILFEWNDTDEELGEAAQIAARLGVQLRFCRTHSPGRSQRLQTARDVADMIARVAPNALQDLTFQLKEDDDFTDVGTVRLDQLRGLVVLASEYFSKQDNASAWASLTEAMELDGGGLSVPTSGDLASFESLAATESNKILTATACSALINLFAGNGLETAKRSLLRRYIELAPDAADRRHVELDLATLEMLDAHRCSDTDLVMLRASEALDQPGVASTLVSLLGPALSSDHPGVCVALANIFEANGQIDAAILMFERYMALAPMASDSDRVSLHTRRLRGERLVRMAEARQRLGQSVEARALMYEALATDTVTDPANIPDYSTMAYRAKDLGLVARMSAIAASARDFEGAYHAEKRLRTGT